MRGERGFTLLELLVAMTLLGLLSVVMFGGLRFGTQVWRKTEDTADFAGRIRAAQSLLDETISRAYPYFVTGDPAHVAFDGDADAMTFLAPAQEPQGALARISIRAHKGDNGLMLSLASTPELAIDQTGATDKVLLTGLKTLTFSYFGAPDANASPTWRSDWHGRTRPPALVRIHAEFADRHAPDWPDLYVATRISADMAADTIRL